MKHHQHKKYSQKQGEIPGDHAETPLRVGPSPSLKAIVFSDKHPPLLG